MFVVMQELFGQCNYEHSKPVGVTDDEALAKATAERMNLLGTGHYHVVEVPKVEAR